MVLINYLKLCSYLMVFVLLYWKYLWSLYDSCILLNLHLHSLSQNYEDRMPIPNLWYCVWNPVVWLFKLNLLSSTLNRLRLFFDTVWHKFKMFLKNLLQGCSSLSTVPDFSIRWSRSSAHHPGSHFVIGFKRTKESGHQGW